MTILSRIKNFVLRKKGVTWAGSFDDWSEAESVCHLGYASEQILQQVIKATRKVESGEAAYERDSVVFDTVHYSWPLLAALNWAAALEQGNLRVVDFGGALGSAYRQNKVFLSKLVSVSWCVVEQPEFVVAGNKEFMTETLRFESSLDVAVENFRPNIILLLSVLQYLETPYAWLEKASLSSADVIFIDRTLVSSGKQERLTVQTTPPEIYEAMYPCWLLSEERLFSILEERYELVDKFYSDFNRELRIEGRLAAHEVGYFFVKKEVL